MSTSPRKPTKPTPPPARPWRSAGFSFETKHEKGHSADVAKGLEKIYLNDTAKQDDLKKLHHKKRRWWLRAFTGLVAFCLISSALAWAGLLFLQPNADLPSGSVEVVIDGPESIMLGQEVTYIVRWKNTSFQPVTDAELRLAYPVEFQKTYASPWPTDPTNEAWKLGIVPAGANGLITVKGIFIGNIGTQGAFQAIAVYRQNGDARSKQALVTKALSFTDTVFEGNWNVPAKAVAGDRVDVAFSLHNKGGQSLSGLAARMVLPQGFLPAQATGSRFLPVGSGGEWELALPELSPNATTSLSISGSFVSGLSGDIPFRLRVGTEREGAFVALFESNQIVPVLAGDLSLRLVVNGADADRAITPGEPLRISLSYKNVSPEPLGDVRLEVSFESVVNGASATGTSLLDWSRLEDATRGVSSTRPRLQSIVYNKSHIAGLESLAPSDEGVIELAIPTIGAASGTKTADIRLQLSGTMATVGKDKVKRDVKANPVKLSYRSDADLAVEARYFTEEGAPLGSGPLPPVAGKTTVYRVIWSMTKNLHTLENMQVEAVLPASVAWNASSLPEAGEISFDETTRTVRWKLNQVPEDVKELHAWFDISLTPTDLDIGRFARLVGDTTFTASDPIVLETIERKKPALTSDLQTDEGASGKGVVRKP